MNQHATKRDGQALILIVSIVVVMYGLFFFRTANGGDYTLHLQFAQQWEAGTLQIPHFVFHLALIVTHQLLSVSYSVSTGIVLSGTMAITACVIFIYLRRLVPTLPTRYIANSTLALLFWGPINPEIALFGYHTTYPLYNPTTIAVLPFAFLLFWLCLRSIESNRVQAVRIALMALLTIGSTLIKPNFTIAIVPAIGAYLLIDRRKTAWINIILGLMLPALIALLWQYLFWFGAPGDPQGGVGIAPFAVLLHHADSMLLSEISPYLAIAKGTLLSFLYVFVIFRFYTPLKDRRVQIALLITLVALLQGFLFVENNDLWPHGNFLWGVKIANFVLPVVMTGYLLQQLSQNRGKRLNIWIKLTYGLHIISGLAWLIVYIVIIP